MNDELLTVAEVAERLKINQQTVRNWIDQGRLSALRVGARRVRIPAGEVERLIGGSLPTVSAKGDAEAAQMSRKVSVKDLKAVATVVDRMLTAAARLPHDSALALELAECAGRLQMLLRSEQRGG